MTQTAFGARLTEPGEQKIRMGLSPLIGILIPAVTAMEVCRAQPEPSS